MRPTRLRTYLLMAPLACAVLGVAGAFIALAGWPAHPEAWNARIIGALAFALLALGVSLAQLIWHARAATSERKSQAAQMAESQQALDSVSDGVIVYDNDWRFLYMNRSAALVAAKPRETLIGTVLWEAYPELIGGELHRHYLEAQRAQSGCGFEYYSEPTRQWLEIRLFPTPGRITVVLRDVSIQHAALARLEEANQGIAQQLARSEQMARSLGESNRLLGERNRQLQEFAQIASHDLQEPLRKIRIFGEMLRERAQTLDDTGRDYLERILGASVRMQSLISSLLAFARVGANQPARIAVDFRQLVDAVVADLIADGPSMPPLVSMGELPRVVGDPVLLRQAVQNLIANAMKFLKPGERAQIDIRSETFRPDGASSDWCRISVRDSGIGFDPAESEQIFDLFRRLHGRARYEGSGIGLAIVRRVVEHHGGRVRAQGSPGVGATFQIELPLTPAPSDRHDDPPTENSP